MTIINLKEFFYWYIADEFIEVTEEVAEELRADKRYNVSHWRRLKRNKANYSLDAGDGIENDICEFDPSPEECMALMEQYRRLCCALNSLPPIQGRRVYKHYLLNMTQAEIATEECVSVVAVSLSIQNGLERMKKLWCKF